MLQSSANIRKKINRQKAIEKIAQYEKKNSHSIKPAFVKNHYVQRVYSLCFQPCAWSGISLSSRETKKVPRSISVMCPRAEKAALLRIL